MLTIRNFLMVGLGGGIGAMLRFFFSMQGKTASFPYATLLINISGSLLIGIFFAWSTRQENFGTGLQLFFMTGICGGFTTFSAFSLENVQLLRAGLYGTAALYICMSVAACIAAAFLGCKIIQQ